MCPQQKIAWIVMWMTALAQASITLYLPAFPAISADLHMDAMAVKSSITVFLLAYGFSQIFYGPLSDRYGRKPVLLTGITIFCLGCLLNVFVSTPGLFLSARFLQGLGCGSLIVIGRTILRDSFAEAKFSSVTSYLSMGFALGLGISPLIGGLLTHYINWRADFIGLFVMGLSMMTVIWRWLPETFDGTLKQIKRQQFFSQTFVRYKVIISNGSFLKFLLGGVFAYAVVVAYNIMTPFLIQKVLGYSAVTYGWLTLLVALPYYFAASANRNLVLKYGTTPIFIFGVLLIIFAGAVLALSCFSTKVSLSVIMVSIMIATYGQALIFPNAIAGALQSFPPHMGANASAILSSFQMMLMGVISAAVAIPADNTPLPLAIVLIGLGILSGVMTIGKVDYLKKILVR